MPVCEGCGGSYDDKFKFCPNCGRAKPEPELIKVQVSVSSEDRWETCKILYREWKNWWSKSASIAYDETAWVGEFWAEGIGSQGKYVVGESPVYLHKAKGDANFAHTFLVNQLSRDGWDAIPSSGEWWQTQFRRRMVESNPKPWQLWFVYTAL